MWPIRFAAAFPISKKLHRRGRGARRGNNGQKLKARMQGKKRPSFAPFPEDQYGKEAFRKRSLRSLPSLRSSHCLQSRRIERQRGAHVCRMICAFCLYPRKALRSLRTLRLISSSSSEGTEAFIISYATRKESITWGAAPPEDRVDKKHGNPFSRA